MNKHDEVIEDILKNTDLMESLSNFLDDSLTSMHMGLGLYIRNKYLWTSKANGEYFMKYYHKDDIDAVSNCIIRDIISIIIKKY